MRLKLARRSHIISLRPVRGRRLRVRGKIIRPLTRPRRRVLIREYVDCRRGPIVRRVRVRRNGRFRATFRPRNASGPVGIYRVESRIARRSARTRGARRRGFRTLTPPVPTWLR